MLNLFLDPDIIPLGPLGLLAAADREAYLFAAVGAGAGRYAEIGRRSPIATLTERQRVRAGGSVSPYIDPVAVIAMRYWHPMTSEAVELLRKAEPVG